MSSPKFDRKMYYGAPGYMKQNAIRLRSNPTLSEEVLWQQLKNRPLGYKFRRQHAIAAFVADFYCHRAKLIIEVDGKIHDQEATKRNDKEREWNLHHMGLTILRSHNDDVLYDLTNVMEIIKSHLLSSTPSLKGGPGRAKIRETQRCISTVPNL